MKSKVWVLCTVLTDKNAPAMPAVFADETEARAKYDEIPNGTAGWTGATMVRIRATPMKPKTGFATQSAPNGAGGS